MNELQDAWWRIQFNAIASILFFLFACASITFLANVSEITLLYVPAVILGGYGCIKTWDDYETDMIFWRTAKEDHDRRDKWLKRIQHDEQILEERRRENPPPTRTNLSIRK